MSVYKVNCLGETLKANSYGGRGIIIGKSPSGKKAVIGYFIMGRSENSRNRVFVENGDEVLIKPFDVSKVEDPSLIIYSPIKKYDNSTIVTNGDQTDTIYEFLKAGSSFEGALKTRKFEPDAPNFTPRISGIVDFTEKDFSYKMSILKSGDEHGHTCSRYFYEYEPIAGIGHYIHTYLHDGDPIPTFCGEPERVEVLEDIDKFTNLVWSSLDENNKVSLYVRYIDLETDEAVNRMINRNK